MPLVIRKRGKFWFARGTVPARQPNGEIKNVRIEKSTRSESKTRAREIASAFERYYYELAYNPKPKSISFAEAALTYIQTRGKSDRFVTKLIEFFGETPLADIDQAALTKAAHTLYPDASTSTHNRAIFTPVSAISRASGHMLEMRRPPAPTTHREIPTDAWFDRLLPFCPPRLGALILFVTLTGRRVGEAIGLKKADLKGDTVTIAKTKTGTTVTVKVPQICLDYLNAPNPKGYTGGDRSKHLFGYHSLQAADVALQKACKRAGVPKFGFHAIGRHSFATRSLKAGKSTKWVKEAGGWETMRSLERYLHLEQSEVQQEMDRMGQEWGRGRGEPPKEWRKR